MSKVQHTKRQGEYLAFISQYEMLMEISPSEGDIAAFFEVASPSVHQMVVTLEKKGALRRARGMARSIQLLVDAAGLPVIGWPGSRFRPPKERSPTASIVAMLEFADFLIHRICKSQAMVFAKAASASRLADRVSSVLESLAVPEELTELMREYIMAMPWESDKRTAVKRSSHSTEVHEGRSSRKAPKHQHVRREKPNQSTLS